MINQTPSTEELSDMVNRVRLGEKELTVAQDWAFSHPTPVGPILRLIKEAL